jgi:hypothetical protein
MSVRPEAVVAVGEPDELAGVEAVYPAVHQEAGQDALPLVE